VISRLTKRRYGYQTMVSECCYRVGDLLVLVVVDGNSRKLNALKRANKTKSPSSGRRAVRPWPFDVLSATAKRWCLLTMGIDRRVHGSYTSPHGMFDGLRRCCHVNVNALRTFYTGSMISSIMGIKSSGYRSSSLSHHLAGPGSNDIADLYLLLLSLGLV
jgi:hypothetical protein